MQTAAAKYFYGYIRIAYIKENETADNYIEKFVRERDKHAVVYGVISQRD